MTVRATKLYFRMIALFIVVMFLTIPLASAETYKQIEMELEITNDDINLVDGINISDPKNRKWSNYNLTWMPFTSPNKAHRVSYWRLDENNNTLPAQDSVGDNHGVYPTGSDPSVVGVEGTGVEMTTEEGILIDDFEYGYDRAFTYMGYYNPSVPKYSHYTDNYMFRVVREAGPPESIIVGDETSVISEELTVVNEIYDWHDLNMIRGDVCADYVLMNDLDETTAGYLDYNDPSTDGWVPIGSSAINRFEGSLNGGNHTISGLYANNNINYMGLFGYIHEDGVIENLNINNAEITSNYLVGGNYIGILAGMNDGTINNTHVMGTVKCGTNGGGLLGGNSGTVSNSTSYIDIEGHMYLGGLIGYNIGFVNYAFASGTINGTMSRIGGFVGIGTDGSNITNSYSLVTVYADDIAGGFIGENTGFINNSYSTSNVYISDLPVSGVGGFVGYNNQGNISYSYSIGRPRYLGFSDPTDKGFAGMVTIGGYYGMVGNFWDMDTSHQTSTAGDATGKTTTEMQSLVTFTDADWNITGIASEDTKDNNYIWNIVDTNTYPVLSWEIVVKEEFAVVTLYSTDLSDESVIIWGVLHYMGTYSSIDVSFDFREDGEIGWTNFIVDTMTDTGFFNYSVVGLDSNTTYEFRAVGESGGITNHGEVLNFTTYLTPPSISNPMFFDTTTNSTGLVMNINSMGDSASIDVFFVYRQYDYTGTWNETTWTTHVATGSHFDNITDLNPSVTYIVYSGCFYERAPGNYVYHYSVNPSYLRTGTEGNISMSLSYYTGGTNYIRFRINDNDGNHHEVRYDTTLNDEWYHITVTAGLGRQSQIYVNGVNVSAYTSPLSTAVLNTTFNFDDGYAQIGRNAVGDVFDEIRIYDTFMSDEDIDIYYGNPKGSVSCALFPPSKIQIDDVSAGEIQSVTQFTTFSHKDIMEGSSVHWWRAPFDRLTDDVDIKLSIYQVSSLRKSNVTYGAIGADGWYELEPDWVADPRLVYEEVYNTQTDGDYVKMSGIDETTDDGNYTYRYNMTYVKAHAPIYSNLNYMVVWQWVDSGWDGNSPAYIYVTQSDVGNNEYYFSIWRIKGDLYYPPICLLTDVLFEYGLSSKVAGIVANSGQISGDATAEFTTEIDLVNSNTPVGFYRGASSGSIDVVDTNIDRDIDDFSISFWTKYSGTSVARLLRWENSTEGVSATVIPSSTGEIRFGVSNTTGDDAVVTTALYNDDTWRRFTFTRSGSGASGLKLYVNGSEVATTTIHNDGVGTLSNMQNITIASRECSIDDIRIYKDRVLTVDEVNDLWRGRAISRFNILHWFAFDSDGTVGNNANGDTVTNLVPESTYINGTVNALDGEWVAGVEGIEVPIDQDIFTFTMPFSSYEPVDITLRITMNGNHVWFNFDTNDFIIISECVNLWLGSGESTDSVTVRAYTDRPVGLWLMDRHKYASDYYDYASSLIHLNTTGDVRRIGFVPYHTMEIMTDTLFCEKPTEFGLAFPPLQTRRETNENQRSLIQIAGEWLYVNVFTPMLEALKNLGQYIMDGLKGIEHTVWEKLCDFGAWTLDGLQYIGGFIKETVVWLVNAYAWMLLSMMRALLTWFSLAIFIGGVGIIFKFTNYWVIVGTNSWKDANDYLVGNVGEMIQKAQGVATAVATKGASLAGKFKGGE